MIEHPGGEFALFVGHVEEEGSAFPFEVWVNGASSRAASARWRRRCRWTCAPTTARGSRSSSTRSRRRRATTPSRCPSRRTASGSSCRASSPAFAQVVRWRCEQLGALDEKSPDLLSPEGRPHPVLDAMFAVEEPRTGTDGTLSWTVDVRNPASGDDFVLGLKEITLPDGITRPYSMWLSGHYPRALDGLCGSSRSTCACSTRPGSA